MLVEEQSGWTTKIGIKRILEQYIVCIESDRTGEELESFVPFHGLGASAAERLLKLLPSQQLDGRQNYGPTTLQLLQAAAAHPDQVELVGYAIGPTRPDERVSIEGFVYYGAPDFHVEAFHETSCECDVLWEYLERELGLDSALDRPDEITKIRPSWNPGREGWWVWWD
ncbi:MAG: hypothetical protein E7I43_03425 [Actinomyces sp.]|uniref:hypothetical protein n=1 Tax=Actinomycetaceae TaxID=2049 RepID=UPI00265B4A53|nr:MULTISPECIES: hypothetical protein [Actinomycetaceae]MDK7143711.1 hypothetical protein [Gleimia europaea]MDU4286713.1 hypothetical protein [Actinomyces sp.]MDU6679718.1 hypothetical protein [Actinomyces sp.]